ncbi:MAG: PspA-associated protein PspAB, partial [Gaiellaceae bacterium]
MGLGDVLFGRKKLKEPAGERLFALSTARVTLETELGLRFAGAGAVVYKPLSAGAFDAVSKAADELLGSLAQESGSTVERKTDTYGYEWVIVRDPDLEDVVAAVHSLGSELQAQGFGAQLLTAAFRFDGGKLPVYWLYGYKRGSFWPFVPSGEKSRDNAEELELKAKLEG